MSGSRDLSGFGTPPVDRPATRRPTPPKPEAVTPTRKVASSRKQPAGPTAEPPSKRRINLSLPLAVAEDLRRFTESENTFYLDVVLRAHALHGEGARSALQPGSGPPPLRRRKPLGRVQIALAVPTGALAELDREAASLDIDRSSYVTELLTVYLREVDAEQG